MNAWNLSVLLPLVLAATPGPAPAQAPALDHLKCYSIKDPVPEGRHWVTVDDFFGSERCEVKVPAVFFCTGAGASDVVPPVPGGGPAGAPAGDFLCYEVIRCDGAPPEGIEVEDAFGLRTVSFHKSRLLCAPAGKTVCGRCLYLLSLPPECSDTVCTPEIGCMPNEICDPVGCPTECPCCPVCGDGLCEGDETECGCLDDCTATPRCWGICHDNVPQCGDGFCDRCAGEGESHETCPEDCLWPCRTCS